MNEIDALRKRVADLEATIKRFAYIDRYQFDRTLAHAGPKLGFFAVAPTMQFADPTGRADTSGSSGVTMTTGHRFNGNNGTNFLSVGDLVFSLKEKGLVAIDA